MQIAGVGALATVGQATSTAVAAAPPSAAATAASGSAASSPEATLLAYFKMSPAEKMRFDIMSQMGITQADYNQMTPAQKAVVDAEIKQKMKQQIQQMTEKKTGLIVDVKA